MHRQKIHAGRDNRPMPVQHRQAPSKTTSEFLRPEMPAQSGYRQIGQQTQWSQTFEAPLLFSVSIKTPFRHFLSLQNLNLRLFAFITLFVKYNNFILFITLKFNISVVFMKNNSGLF